MKNTAQLKLKIFTNIGAALEYYDYIIFAYLISTFSVLFFPNDAQENMKYLKDIQMLLLFSISSISRIIGSFILGFLSTRYGKSFVMLASIYLMALSTFTIGVLPTYEKIGILAPILLLLCRFIQGVAYSVELPSSSVFIFDYSKNNYGQALGFLISSTTLGCVVATFTMYLFTTFFPPESLLSYLWRVPFLFGGIVGIFGIYIRSSLSNNFDNKIYSILEIWQSLKRSKIQLLEASSVLALPASLIVIYIYLEIFFTGYFLYSKSQIYLISSLGLIFSIICGLFSGIILDKKNQSYKKYCYYSFLILYPLIWLALYLQSFFILVVFAIIFQFFTTNFMIFALYHMNNIFKDNIKTIFIIVIYNFIFLLCGFIPILAKKFGVLTIAIALPYILALKNITKFNL